MLSYADRIWERSVRRTTRAVLPVGVFGISDTSLPASPGRRSAHNIVVDRGGIFRPVSISGTHQEIRMARPVLNDLRRMNCRAPLYGVDSLPIFRWSPVTR